MIVALGSFQDPGMSKAFPLTDSAYNLKRYAPQEGGAKNAQWPDMDKFGSIVNNLGELK